MSVTSISSAAAASVKSSHAASPQARSADGDYKVKSAATSQTKDADGDYKPKTAAASSSSGVLSALTAQKLGG